MKNTLKALVLCTAMLATSSFAQCSKGKDNALDTFLANKGFTKLCFQKLASQHAIVEVSVNGFKSNFIIDSGASVSVINNSDVSKFRLIPASGIANVQATGVGGKVTTQSFMLDIFKIDQLKIKNKHIVAMDLSHIVDALTTVSDKEINGVIGQDILTRHKAVIDIASNTLYLMP